ncbi:MAG TPA: glycosyltransferase family 4 protein [Micromonosporaceae bacterium]
MRKILGSIAPRRARQLARRAFDRRHDAGQAALHAGAVLVPLAAAVVGAVFQLWVAVAIVVAATLVAAAIEIRRLVRARRLRRRAIGALAEAGRSEAGGLEPELVPYAARALLDRGNVLDAYALLARHDALSITDLPTRLRLRDGLHARGYLRAALGIARACVAGYTGWLYRARLRELEGQWRVLSGEADQTIPVVRPTGFSPIAGRVLHIVATSLPQTQSGYTIRSHYITSAQVAAGLDVHVVTHAGYDARRRAIATTIEGVTYHHPPGPKRHVLPLDRWLAHNIAAVADVVSEVRPAVLHAASDYVNALTARTVGHTFGLPVVYETRGFWEETWLSRQAEVYGWDLDRLAVTHGLPDVYLLRREIEDRCRREAERVVTLADVMADRIEAGGVDRDKIWVIPNAVDVDAFPVQQRNDQVAVRLGIGAGKTVIGYISSLTEYEGVDTLIDAYSKVRATGHDQLALLIVGDGMELERLTRRAGELRLPDVVFTGRVAHEEILDYYSVIDIFVVPRKPVEVCHLVTPLKPFEAFATGRTVVMSDVRALAEIAVESQAAELFTAGSVDSLATTLVSLIGDDARRMGLAAAGAAWVRSNRTWSANAKAYMSLYGELGVLGRVPTQRPRSE